VQKTHRKESGLETNERRHLDQQLTRRNMSMEELAPQAVTQTVISILSRVPKVKVFLTSKYLYISAL